MPTFWALALTLSLFSAYVGSGNLQETKVGDQVIDLVGAESTIKNETKKEDKLTKILPLVTFDCTGRTEGYYADIQFDCEAFHYCKPSGERYTFVCPPKSRFNQKHMVCDYDRYGMKLCYTAEKYFKLNENLYPKTKDQTSNNGSGTTTTTKTTTTTTTVKPKEKTIKNETFDKKEAKYSKTKIKKPKLEKTYIVTEYYDSHDRSTTEQPLIDDGSPKVYKWYTPPVTSDVPFDDVDYDDSVRQQYEYTDDYPEDLPDYDDSDGHEHDGNARDHLESHSPEKDNSNDKHKQTTNSKFNKNTESKLLSSLDGKPTHKNKPRHEEDDKKEFKLHNNNYGTSRNERRYEESKDVPRSKLGAQIEARKKEAPERTTVDDHREIQVKNDNYKQHNYAEPAIEESQEHERENREEIVEHRLNPISATQPAEDSNYRQRHHIVHKAEPETHYYQNREEDQNKNYAVHKEEQSQELRDIRNRENDEFESTEVRKPIDSPKSKHSEIVDTRNLHHNEERDYRAPNSKPHQYKVVINHPEVNTRSYTHRRVPDNREPKKPSPEVKSKTLSFYRRYTAKEEQPNKTTVYTGPVPQNDDLYDQRELKDLHIYQKKHPQIDNTREVPNEQRAKQIYYPNIEHEQESSQEESKDAQEGSYEETEELNSRDIPIRQYYKIAERQRIPQRNTEIYVEQESPQQREIETTVPYKHHHNGNRQSYQQDVPQKEDSEEVVTDDTLLPHRAETSSEKLDKRDKMARYREVHYKRKPEVEYYIPKNQHATRNERNRLLIVNSRPYNSNNNQFSNQNYKKTKETADSDYRNRNVKENYPTVHHELIVQQQNVRPEQQHYHQQNNQEYIPGSKFIPADKKQLNKVIYMPHNEGQNFQQQHKQINYRHQIIPQHSQQIHQPHSQALHSTEVRYLQHHSPQNIPHFHGRTPHTEQPRIHIITRRQKRQATNGLPLSNQFRTLLSRLYTPAESPSNNYLNNFQNFISNSFSPPQSSATSTNPTQQRTTNYSPQYNTRYLSPYNPGVQTLYDRSPIYTNPAFEQFPNFYEPPNRPPLSSNPTHFRYYDDNGERLAQNIGNFPRRPDEEIPSPPQAADNNQKDDVNDKSPASGEPSEGPNHSKIKPTIYPPLSAINPQSYPELKDFPFFNPSYSYSNSANASLKDTDNSHFSYNRIPPPRYNVPDLGVYFDPYGEIAVTPLYDMPQASSDDTKDSDDSTESPTNSEEPRKNEGKFDGTSRRRVPGKIKRPLNTVSNPLHEEKTQYDKSKEETSLFVTSPPQKPISTYGPESVHLFVTPPSFLRGHSRQPSVFGPEFFVPPLRSPFTTESTLKEETNKPVTQDNSLETSSEITTEAPRVRLTTPTQRQRPHRRRPQSTVRPTQGSRGTTRHPSSRPTSRRPSASERGSSRHTSQPVRPNPDQRSRQTTRHPSSTRPPTRSTTRERPKPATLPLVRPTQQASSESDESNDEIEPNPFRGSVPYGTRLRRPPPSRQTSSQVSHESGRASITKRVHQPSASDQSITLVRKEQPQNRHIQSVERSHQPRRAINQFRATTQFPISTTTNQPPQPLQTVSSLRNIFRYSNEEETTIGYSPNENNEQTARRQSVRRATYIRKNQEVKPETKPKLFRGRVRTHHPRRGYSKAAPQRTTTTTTSTTTTSTTSTTESTTTPKTTTSTISVSPSAIVKVTTPQTVETESTPKLRVYTSRHGGSLRNERVINRLKDKPRLFTFGRPRGTAADDSNFDDTNYATESSSESE